MADKLVGDLADALVFAEGESPVALAEPGPAARPWRVLVVDDNPDVHAVTRQALRRVRFRDRPLELLSAHTAGEALASLRAHPDTALVLLDVVMETGDAGLALVRAIREDLGNRAVRIVLRTGHPGQAPERQVVLDYDINDYHAKTELTAARLFTSVIAGLRSHADMLALEANHRGLRRIIQETDCPLGEAGPAEIAALLLAQAGRLLDGPAAGLVCTARARAEAGDGHPAGPRFELLAAVGDTGRDDAPDGPALAALEQAWAERRSVFAADWAALHIPVAGASDAFAYVRAARPLDTTDRDLLSVLASKMAASFGNAALYARLRQANAELRGLAQTLEARVAERTRALVEANARLERQASVDSLTGILNRRRFMELAGAELERAQRYRRTFTLLLIDLDNFKRVNDDHGHCAGDTVIRQAAERTARSLRATDSLGRFGGEEFLVLLPETDAAAAQVVAERIRRQIGGDPILHGGAPILQTASIGVAEWSGPDEPLAALINRADQAMYAAKQQGRDRVEICLNTAA